MRRRVGPQQDAHLALVTSADPTGAGNANSGIALGGPDQVQRKGELNRPVNLEGLIALVTGRQDDQDIHVAIGVRLVIPVRAEQDDVLRQPSRREDR
jgi:hypothetical protein